MSGEWGKCLERSTVGMYNNIWRVHPQWKEMEVVLERELSSCMDGYWWGRYRGGYRILERGGVRVTVKY